MYVISLTGKDIFQGNIIVCTSAKISNLDKVLAYIKQEYDIEFEEYSTNFIQGCWWCFNNITDDRDISLIIEDVPTDDDIAASLS